MKPRSLRGRKARNMMVNLLSVASAVIGIFFLVWILWIVIHRGSAAFVVKGEDGSSMNWGFFTQLPSPPGTEGGGLGNAILGTLLMTLMAAGIGVPLGILAGVFLSEYGLGTRFGGAVRFMVNTMMGLPSIIVGLFVYTLLVKPFGSFNGYAGGVALALLIMPIVARTTEDMLRLVPNDLREAALALGTPRWRTTVDIVFRSARVGIITGILLAVARVSGETAPLLFTALNSDYWPQHLSEPTANLTVTIFTRAMSPWQNWQDLAWGASLLIMAGVLTTTIMTRMILKERH